MARKKSLKVQKQVTIYPQTIQEICNYFNDRLKFSTAIEVVWSLFKRVKVNREITNDNLNQFVDNLNQELIEKEKQQNEPITEE